MCGLSLLIILLAAGCTGPQHVLATRGPAAERIAGLWWIMLAIAGAVSIAVAMFLAIAIRAARARHSGRAVAEVPGRTIVIAGGVAVPALILFGVLIYSYRVSAEVYPGPASPDALIVEVVGHQFWWEVRYPQHGVVTANEIHIPAGRPIEFRVTSPDVIHSFWIPQLHGKIDMIPGQLNVLRVVADEPGTFRGQCAEFCGEGHALMGFWVMAHEPEAFRGWLARQTAPQAPADPSLGREIFFAAGCGDCHATRGAPLPEALGEPAPDLSDLASRAMITAATIPNTRPYLRAWILAPEAIKPGALMPPTSLPIEEMEALLDYLESLR